MSREIESASAFVAAQTTTRACLERREGQTCVPASAQQRGLWLAEQLTGTSTPYHSVTVLRLQGKLDRAALSASLDRLVARHETLRTHFLEDAGELYQVIAAPKSFTLTASDHRGASPGELSLVMERALKAAWEEPFDLRHGPLVRSHLLQFGAEEHVLVRTLHHIVSDAWSTAVFNRDLFALYQACCTGRADSLPHLPVQYAEYALRQRQWSDEGGLKDGLAYWRRQLAEPLAPLMLPADHACPHAAAGSRAASVAFVLPRQTVAGLVRLAQAHESTLYMTLLAALALLLGRFGGQDDVIVGSPIANRQDWKLRELIGCFVNLLPMRVRVTRDQTFSELLGQVRRVAMDAYRHQEVPFEQVVASVAGRRTGAAAPLLQATVNVLPETQPINSPALSVAGVSVLPPLTRFDLELTARPEAGALTMTWLYNAELFDQWRVQEMAQRLTHILEAALRNPGERSDVLVAPSAEERQTMLGTWNATNRPVPERSVDVLVEEHVAVSPDRVAIQDGARSITYAALDRRAERLTSRLRLRLSGKAKETVIAVAMPRSIESVIAMLAVLKAGGTYLPLDLSYPPERVRLMLADSGAELVLINADHPLDLRNAGLDTASVFKVDEGVPSTDAPPGGGRPSGAPRHPDQLAYVIYTSGSTGTPKACAIPHRGIVRLVRNASYAEIRAGDRVAQLASLAFDASVFEIWSALLNGGTLVIFAHEIVVAPATLSAALRDARIDVALIATPLFNELTRIEPLEPHGVRTLLFGGDVADAEGVRQMIASGGQTQLVHAYGPTENSVISSAQDVSAVPAAALSIPIGGPISNSRLYVLDDRLEPVPSGVVGEVFVAGEGLARGYLGRRALTAERFVADPYGRPGARAYRTGDMARWRASGVLEFVGRIDHQVKVRGIRVELGEIEAALRRQPGVEDAVVVAHGGGHDRHLCAYIVKVRHHDATADGDPTSELRIRLRQVLPEHLVPAVMVALPALPLKSNGKVDRQALPAPPAPARASAPPRTPEEATLCELFASVLPGPSVGITDDFFALGGHSLAAMQLTSRVRAVLGVDLPVLTVFECPTVAAMSAALRRVGRPAHPILRYAHRGHIPLSSTQRRLWFLDRLYAGTSAYNTRLVLRLHGPLDVDALVRAANGIVERHEVLRTRIGEHDGEPFQVVEAPAAIDIPVDDLSAIAVEDRAAPTEGILRKARTEPFDLASVPLFRLRLVKLGDQDHLLVRTTHHIVTDAWSERLFTRELFTLYDAFSAGRSPTLPPLPVQYGDFAVWQRQMLTSDALSPALEYWRRQLAHLPEECTLPSDRARPRSPGLTAGRLTTHVPAELASELRHLGHQRNATLYMTLLTAFAALVSRYNGQTEIVIGSSVANRPQLCLEGLLGAFVNMLPTIVNVDPSANFGDMLDAVRRTTLDGYRYQDVPFERLVEIAAPVRQLDITPLIHLVFEWHTAAAYVSSAGGLRIEPAQVEEAQARFDLELHGVEHASEITFTWVYSEELFDRWRIELIADHFGRVLAAIVADPTRSLHALTDTLAVAPRPQLCMDDERPTVLDSFHARVAATPDAPAVDAGECRLTYAELSARASRLARVLIARGIGPELIVGIALEPSVDQIVAMLGILEAGAAYLPLDLALPPDRLAWMMRDASPALVVTRSEHVVRFPIGHVAIDAMNEEAPLVEQAALDPQHAARVRPLRSGNLAYVLYTSGSSGRPKAVGVEHRALQAYLEWASVRYGVDAPSQVPINTPLSFDATITSLHLTLITGHCVVVLPESRQIEALASFLAETPAVALVKLTPAHLRAVTTILGPLVSRVRARRLVVGGEALEGADIKHWRERAPGLSIFNEYGPTEATVGCCIHEADHDTSQSSAVPIGRPTPGTQLYVLDARMSPAPLGAVGELYIAGAQLARGYVRRSALTAGRYVADPFGAPGTRMYRTGDLAYWRPDETLVFVGRHDRQLKLRGYRVEPGEIEAALRRDAAVADARVLAHTDKDRGVEAFVLARKSIAPASAARLGQHLRQGLFGILPSYMVPNHVHVLSAWPLTLNGKIDEPGLLALVTRTCAPAAPSSQTSNVAKLRNLFSDVLKIAIDDDDSDFFRLGGHSLLATQLVSRIRSSFGVDVPLGTIFDAPTPATLAMHLRDAASWRPPLEPQQRPARVPASTQQRGLWLVQQLTGTSTPYHSPSVMRLKGPLDHAALAEALARLVARHEVLRTHFCEEAGELYQVVEPPQPLALTISDYRAASPEMQTVAVDTALRAAWEAPFDLQQGPLIRVDLLRFGAEEHILIRTLHHIVSDAWSNTIFNRELFVLYDVCLARKGDPLPALPVQYADYALWQRQWLDEGGLQAGLAYWRRQLADPPPPLTLAADFPRPSRRTQAAGVLEVTLPSETVATLTRLAQAQQATLYMVLLAGFAVLLARYAGQNDVIVASPIANRQDARAEELIGCFVNTLALRVRIERDQSFHDLLAQVRRTALEAYRHQDVPFDQIVAAVAPRRAASVVPLAQVVFELRNAPRVAPVLQGLTVDALFPSHVPVRTELEVHAWDCEGDLSFMWIYDKDLFAHWRVDQMARHYCTMMTTLAYGADAAR